MHATTSRQTRGAFANLFRGHKVTASDRRCARERSVRKKEKHETKRTFDTSTNTARPIDIRRKRSRDMGESSGISDECAEDAIGEGLTQGERENGNT
jgi:hypothetical protein